MDQNSNHDVAETTKDPHSGQDSMYLQRELGNCLPTALATVVSLQPSDPIYTLALFLLKYRELNPLPKTTNDADNDPLIQRVGIPQNKCTTAYNEQKSQSLLIEHWEENCDDSVPTQLQEIPSKTTVHSDVVAQFIIIGDLYDDDDV